MGKVGGAALAAAAAAVLGGAAPDVAREVCELPQADRATTRAARCMACHDGSAGAGVQFRMRAGSTPGFDHPVEVDYASAAARNRGLRPAPGPGTVLVDGRISCTTCHDGRSALRASLARPQPELCLSCHDL